MKDKAKILMMGIAAVGVVFTYIYAGYCQQGEEKLAIKTEASVEAVDAPVVSSVGAVLQSQPEKKEAKEERPQLVQKEEPEVVTVETVSGEVSGVTKDGISIVYNRNYETGMEYEIVVPIDKRTALKHLKNLDEIAEGDLISIEYQKSNKNPAYARTITFIQHAATGLVSKEEPVEEVPQE